MGQGQDPLFARGRGALPPLRATPTHIVQFYEPSEFPARNIADYFCAGIEAEESCLIVAIPAHTRMIKDCLESCGVEAEALERAGLLTCVDVEPLLVALQKSDLRSETSIADIFGHALQLAMGPSRNGRIRVYGEIVDLLARHNEYEKCVQLERNWNQFLVRHSLHLYCAYSLTNFPDRSSAGTLCDLCDLHDEIADVTPDLPPEGWQALLLQRSRARQSAIQGRKAVERSLHRWEAEYARLFDAHVAHWRECIELGLTAPTPPGRPPYSRTPAAGHDDLGPAVERALQEIVLACGEACAARKSLVEGSVEWHKTTGEILAYGKLTSVLDSLQKQIRTRRSH